MVELSCPRCNCDMALTDEHREKYVFCKHCEGRVWVPAELTSAHEKNDNTTAVQPPPKVAQPDASNRTTSNAISPQLASSDQSR